MAAVFLANGAVFANWVARVPAIKDSVDAGTGALGLALLGVAVGSLVTMPFSGRLSDRYGSDVLLLASGLGLAVSAIGPALAPNPVWLSLALAVYGGSFGLLDVAMNVQAVAVVRRLQRPVMPWFHAAFSLGGLLGAATGGLAAGFDITPTWHFSLVALATVATMLAVRPYLLPDRQRDEEPGSVPAPRRAPRHLTLVVVGLGAIALCAAMGEGAMADWTALFLRDVRGVDAGIAALGYAGFSVTMTAGRLGGEAAIRRAGPVRVLRMGGLAAGFGVGLAVVLASPLAGIVGFGLVGLGLSCAFPLALTTAGESSDGSGSSEIAAVSVIGYTGFLIGPPFIGLLAEAVELRLAMLALALPALGLTLLAPVVARAQAPATPLDHPPALVPERVCP